jgi:glutathione-independent formaldehyde dehydrogenase
VCVARLGGVFASVVTGNLVQLGRALTVHLRDMIVSRAARPGTIVTHHGALSDAPVMFRAFDARENGVVKAVLTP